RRLPGLLRRPPHRPRRRRLGRRPVVLRLQRRRPGRHRPHHLRAEPAPDQPEGDRAVIDGHPVIAWTPFGRERTVSILVEYMRRDHERGIVDEYWLYLNTDPDQVSDLRYAYQLARRYDWVKI